MQEKAFPLPFYATFGLMAAPPFGHWCATCGGEHGPGNQCVLGQREDPNRFEPGQYAFCTTRGTHALKVCMVLNNRCTRCLYRGHQRNGRCNWVKANLEIFENLAKHGFVTGNRNRDWGASNGFYPIIRLSQLHHVAMNVRYARLLSLNGHKRARARWRSNNQHVCWVGAEPWATQTIVKNVFIQARANKAHSAVQKQDYIRGTQHRVARIRILPK
jgi:hypothetical protein